MPRRDGTGPLGQGPMTGRGFGYCAGYDAPESVYGTGRGFGCGPGRGFRRGFRRSPGYYGSIEDYPVDEKKMLKEQTSFFEEKLKAIKQRMEKLEEE